MAFVIENLRLRELVAIVRQNQKFYDDFCVYLKEQGYQEVHNFINEPSDAKATKVIKNYFVRQSVSPGSSKPATEGQIKTSHSEACLSYHLGDGVQVKSD